MAIDYTKWDKLELSDDSDVEVHPNVDKNSFIRWKQRDIHEKRIQRENQIKGLKVQKEMYTQLNKRVDSLLSYFSNDSNKLNSESERNNFLDSNFDKSEKCTLEEQSDDSPTYNEMVQDLFTQIESDLKKENLDINDENIKKKVIEHRKKIDDVLKQIDPKLEEFDQEKHKHITSDDIHDGWNSSIINKPKDKEKETEKETEKKSTETTTSIETINSPDASSDVKTVKLKKPSKPLAELKDLELLNETIEFSKLDTIKACGDYILAHPYIASTHQKDALLMKAFDYQLEDDEIKTKVTIEKAMLLQFCADLVENPPSPDMPMSVRMNYVNQLFTQLEHDNSPATIAYLQECQRMIDHVKARCKIIKEEQKNEEAHAGEEEVETIQLRSVDPNSKLVVSVPAMGTDAYDIYQTLPKDMRAALMTHDLDEVNKELAKYPLDEAEKMLETFGKCGVIGISALLENEKQFEEVVENEKKFEKMREATANLNFGEKLAELAAKKSTAEQEELD